jgi:hypothetical protein
MKNPWARRWETFARGEDPGERAAINTEAREAEEAGSITCGGCGAAAYYRPGVGAYQCPTCRKMLVPRKVDGEWVDKWI